MLEPNFRFPLHRFNESGHYNAADHRAESAGVPVSKGGAPVLLRFLSNIAARFGVEVGEKAAAQLLPVVGAVGGLSLNIMFTAHFQRIAEGHFTVRRLERTYGAAAGRAAGQRECGKGTRLGLSSPACIRENSPQLSRRVAHAILGGASYLGAPPWHWCEDP